MHSGNGISSELPPQVIPKKFKNKTWKKATLDALERKALVQLHEKRYLNDFYRMTEGKVSYMELSELVPKLEDLTDLLDQLSIPTKIKHYDLLGVILNFLESVMTENIDKFHPTNIDEYSKNELLNIRTELLIQHIKENWDKQFRIIAVQNGLDVDKNDFKSEDEKNQYIQAIQQLKESKTPQEIQEFLESPDYKTKIIEWCEAIMEGDTIRFYMDEINRECIKHLLRTGECYKERVVDSNNYRVEV